jgi:hypothetical protein
VKVLEDKKMFKEAGLVLCDHHFNKEELIDRAIENLIKAGEYFHAVERSLMSGKKDLSQIKKGVNLAYNLKLNEIVKRTSEYKEKVVRLKIVQENKRMIPGVIKPGQ